jgi:hypothetical protein
MTSPIRADSRWSTCRRVPRRGYEAGEPRSSGGVGSADSVVSNREVQVGAVEFDVHSYLGRLCVFGRVGEGFGDDVVGGHCLFGGWMRWLVVAGS